MKKYLALKKFNFNNFNQVDIINSGELLEVQIDEDNVKYYINGKYVGWDYLNDNIIEERKDLFVSLNKIRKNKLNRLI